MTDETTTDAPPTGPNFADFKLPYALNSALKKMKYETPTPIQQKAIPIALQGHDILGSAQTGTGKTAAFGIPLVAYLMNNAKGSALILTPTRELAMQVMDIMQQLLSRQKSLKTALLIGGEAMGKQFAQLAARPRLIVGTPGRINDHLENGRMMLHDTKFLVLDETDRMLDMGFEIQLEAIFRYLPKQRQTLMFSATLPDPIIRLSNKYLSFPDHIAVDPGTQPARNIEMEKVHLKAEEKFPRLVKELKERNGSVIVFTSTKKGCDDLALKLYDRGFKARAIHGDLKQAERNKVLQAFRDAQYRILIATDVAARGLDVPHIEHVINYDLPSVPEDYIHRLGRTARAGASGNSLCFISPRDAEKWQAIQEMMNPDEKGQKTDKSVKSHKPNDKKHGMERRGKRPRRNKAKKPSHERNS